MLCVWPLVGPLVTVVVCPAAVRPGDDEEAFPTSRVDSVFATVFAMAAESVRAAGLVCPATPCM